MKGNSNWENLEKKQQNGEMNLLVSCLATDQSPSQELLVIMDNGKTKTIPIAKLKSGQKEMALKNKARPSRKGQGSKLFHQPVFITGLMNSRSRPIRTGC